MEEHTSHRMASLARQCVADLLAANDADHPVQAWRSLEKAIAGAQEYEELFLRYHGI